MTIHCKAVHEKGVLRPKKPLALAEGEEVELTVVQIAPQSDATDEDDFKEARRVAEFLAEIAALPLEVDDRGFSGRDHDQVLYGKTQTP